MILMFDPMTILMVGAGALAWREMNKKDYGILTPSRDERYRNVMEHCYDPAVLLQESKLFDDHGLKAQALMLRRRSEWRARPQELKDEHEAIYKKALASKNIAPILEVANSFEGWTATKKAATLREHARKLHEEILAEAARKATETVKAAEKESAHVNGANGTSIPRNTEESATKVEVLPGDDT